MFTASLFNNANDRADMMNRNATDDGALDPRHKCGKRSDAAVRVFFRLPVMSFYRDLCAR